MDGMHCIIDGTSILVKIKSVALYNCQTVYLNSFFDHNIVISTAVLEDVFLSCLLFPASICSSDPYARKDCVIVL